MDKNPDRPNALEPAQLLEFKGHNPNVIMSANPFEKTELAVSLLESADCPAIYLDFDLLYSGYAASGMVRKGDAVDVVRAYKDGWAGTLRHAIQRISEERLLVIIDSLNGFYNMYDGLDSARFVNASVMLLSYMAGFKGCPVVVLAVARQHPRGWAMSPLGRRILPYGNSSHYTVLRSDGALLLRREALPPPAPSGTGKTPL